MHSETLRPTPYRDVNHILTALLDEALSVLGQQLIGMYLCGSLALGDFDSASSDIDFLAVTDEPLQTDRIAALGDMHRRFAAGPLGRLYRIDGCYLPAADAHRFKPDAGPFPSWGEEGFKLFHPGGDWIIQRRVICQHPAIVIGPTPSAFIAPVSADDLRWGVADVLQGWWTGQVENPDWIGRRTVLQVFTVQTMCRALYTLELGEVCSKPAALRWAMTALDEPWAGLAGRAAAWTEGMTFAPLDETLALVRYTVARSRAFRVIHTEAKYNVGGAVSPK